MTYKFMDTYEDLQAIISETSIGGKWSDFSDNHKCFKCHGGVNMNWWKSTGTIRFEGKQDVIVKIKHIIVLELEESDKFLSYD